MCFPHLLNLTHINTAMSNSVHTVCCARSCSCSCSRCCCPQRARRAVAAREELPPGSTLEDWAAAAGQDPVTLLQQEERGAAAKQVGWGEYACRICLERGPAGDGACTIAGYVELAGIALGVSCPSFTWQLVTTSCGNAAPCPSSSLPPPVRCLPPGADGSL
jgi:hypothetical protein